MIFYYDKKGALVTVLPHGEMPRQCGSLKIYVYLDTDIDMSDKSMRVRFKTPGKVVFSSDFVMEKEGVKTFEPLSKEENVGSLISGESYYVLSKNLSDTEANDIPGNLQLVFTLQTNEGNEIVKSSVFGRAQIFIEETLGLAPNSGVGMTYNEYMVLLGELNGYDIKISNHIFNNNNPHNVTKEQVGLGNVDNTSDEEKPISRATQEALNNKADKSTTYTKTETNELLDNKADKSTTYTKTETNDLLNNKADKSTTYTKTEIDDKLDDKVDKAQLDKPLGFINLYTLEDSGTLTQEQVATLKKYNHRVYIRHGKTGYKYYLPTALLGDMGDTLVFKNIVCCSPKDTGSSTTSYYFKEDEITLSQSGDGYTWTKSGNSAEFYSKTQVDEKVGVIEEKIPAQASSNNQLADKEFVNSSVATNTATFRDSYNAINDLNIVSIEAATSNHSTVEAALDSKIDEADNNDYCYVLIPADILNTALIKQVDRYKFNGSNWHYEYTLNNSGFTARQWAAINSGITSQKLQEILDDIANTYTKTEANALLNDKADKSTTYTKTEANDLLDNKADKSTTYTKTETNALLDDKADKSTTYTKTETNDLLNNKVDKTDVYTKTQVDGKLDNKADLNSIFSTVKFGQAKEKIYTRLQLKPKFYDSLIVHGEKIELYEKGNKGDRLIEDELKRVNFNFEDSGVSNFDSNFLWTDGENIYYDKDYQHFILDKNKLILRENVWKNIPASFNGSGIWSDGENIYYSDGSTQYVLDKATSTWSTKKWAGLTSFNGSNIWIDGDNIYYSNGSALYLLDKTTSSFTQITTFSRAFYDYTYTSAANSTFDTNETYYAHPNNEYVTAESLGVAITADNFNTYKNVIYIRTSDTPVHQTENLSIDGKYIWSDGDNIYYSNASTQYVLDKETLTWSIKTWTGLTNFYGDRIWTDGENIYYSYVSNQYVLDKTTSTWNTKTWSGLTNFNGSNIWTDGENIYYSSGSTQRVLDKTTSTWSKKTWTGLTNFNGSNIWTDGENIYYSNSSAQYVLDKSTSTWNEKTWIGLTNFYGTCTWSDGDNIYYSNASTQYVLDKETLTWNTKKWTGKSNFFGTDIWTDGENIYYSYDSSSNQYVLDKTTSTWSKKTWTGLTNFKGRYIWTDGENIYYSSSSNQYVLDKTTSTWSSINFQAAFYDYTYVSAAKLTFDENKTYYYLSGGEYKNATGLLGGIPMTEEYFEMLKTRLYIKSDTPVYQTQTLSINGQYIWSDGRAIYYSNGSKNYILNTDNSVFEEVKFFEMVNDYEYVNCAEIPDSVYDPNETYYIYDAGKYITVEEFGVVMSEELFNEYKSELFVLVPSDPPTLVAKDINFVGTDIWSDGEFFYCGDDYVFKLKNNLLVKLINKANTDDIPVPITDEEFDEICK